MSTIRSARSGTTEAPWVRWSLILIALAFMVLFLVLPLVLSIALFLIADIDTPRGGLIHVNPQNLASLVESLRAH